MSEEPFVCFLPERHPLAACKRIDPARLHSEPFIIYERRQAPAFHDRILSICSGSGFSPAFMQEASEMQTILSMVAAEMGVTILPRSSGSLGMAGVIMRPLVGKWPASAIGVAALAASVEDPFLKRFVEVARELGTASR